MRVILVDDESMALDVLESVLSTYSDIDVVKKYINPTKALEEIDNLKVDVIFLDIEMGRVNGLEIANDFLDKGNIEIVFVTAYSQYAVEAFELNAIDYLLKPIQEKRLRKTIERLREKMQIHCIDGSNDSANKDSIIVKSFGGFEVIDMAGNQLAWRTQKAKELFAYLWFQREKPVPKANIIENIFSDKDIEKAMTHLHTTIYQIRKALEKIGCSNGIIYLNDSYQLNVPIQGDVDIIDKILNVKPHSVECIGKLLSIYEGDFLEYDSYFWSMDAQQMYKGKVYNALESHVKEQLESGQVNIHMVNCLNLMSKLDPFNENTAKFHIEYYGIQDMKFNLKKYYEDYIKCLWNEMKLEPTFELYEMYNKYMQRK